MKTPQNQIAEAISKILGRSDCEEVKVGLSTVGHVRRVGDKFRASARVSDPSGTKLIDKHIGYYDTYDKAAEVVLRIRNADFLAIPDKKT